MLLLHFTHNINISIACLLAFPLKRIKPISCCTASILSHLSLRSIAAAVHKAGKRDSSETPFRIFRGRWGAPTVWSTANKSGALCFNSSASARQLKDWRFSGVASLNFELSELLQSCWHSWCIRMRSLLITRVDTTGDSITAFDTACQLP